MMHNKQQQLGWNCFDIAVGINRDDLVRYALENSRSLEFRQLLAPEIRHAATLAAIHMNEHEEQAEENNKQLINLFEFAELGLLDPKKLNDAAVKLLQASKKASLELNALPEKMHNPALRDLVNRYGIAFEMMRPIVSAVNDMPLAKPKGKSFSIAELDEYFAKPEHRVFPSGAYEMYKKAREELLTPVELGFIQYSESEKIFRDYVNTYYAKNGWVAFQRQFAGERSTSMVEIAARMLSTRIIILQPSNGKLTEIYRTTNFSQNEIIIVFNGINHFDSYEEYIRQQQAKAAKSSIVKDSDVDKLSTQLSKTKISTQISIERLILKITNLIGDFERKDLPKKSISFQLKKEFDEIHYYFEHPELVLRGSYEGGLQKVREKYAANLLQISLFVSRSTEISKAEAKVVHRGFNHLAKLYKVKRAYNELYKGAKFKKANLGKFNPQTPISQHNPIMFRSRKNIRNLVALLKKLDGNEENLYGLRDDEVVLFEVLLNLPYRLQHATNHYYEALNAGSLDSYTELKRHNPNYESPFSTKGNIKKLGNGGFVFFRLYVDPINSSQTRYGDSALIFDLNILRQYGWISLHDQLVSFPAKSVATRHFYWNKRLLRTSSVCSLISQGTNDKTLQGGVQYCYRTSEIKSYDSGKKDTLKSFGETIETDDHTINFLNEVFYGPDILIGIALSVIKELRYLETCGFRATILEAIENSINEEIAQLLGELIKGLFRIEGKYPVALRLQADISKKCQFFVPILPTDKRSKEDRAYQVTNPDGDGRCLVDMSINDQAMSLATARERQKHYSERISIIRRQRARYDSGTSKYIRWDKELTKIQRQLEKINNKLGEDTDRRKELIDNFVESFEVDDIIFDKVDTSKLDFINETFIECLEEELVDLEDLLKLSLLQLRLIADERILDLIIDGIISFDEIAECSLEELEALIQYDIKIPIIEQDMTIADLRRLYAEDPRHLIYLTCDDDELYDLVQGEAPDVNPLLMQYAEDNCVDIEAIIGELGESEKQLFEVELGYYDESEQNSVNENEDDYERYSEVNESDDKPQVNNQASTEEETFADETNDDETESEAQANAEAEDKTVLPDDAVASENVPVRKITKK